jgi:hypothetical protein
MIRSRFRATHAATRIAPITSAATIELNTIELEILVCVALIVVLVVPAMSVE